MKFLARIGIAKKTCKECKNFDLAAGQQGIASAAPAFVAAAQVLSPAQIAATALTESERAAEVEHVRAVEAALAEGKTPPPLPQVLIDVQERMKAAPPKVPWKLDEFGACALDPTSAVWAGDSCKDWA